MIDWKHVADGSADVGGRSIEVDQLALSLKSAVRDSFDINDVPAPLVKQAIQVQAGASVLLEDIQKLGQMMVTELKASGLDSRGNVIDHEAEARAKQEVADHLAFKAKVSHRPDPEDL